MAYGSHEGIEPARGCWANFGIAETKHNRCALCAAAFAKAIKALGRPEWSQSSSDSFLFGSEVPFFIMSKRQKPLSIVEAYYGTWSGVSNLSLESQRYLNRMILKVCLVGEPLRS
jgi:hypothetical protein